VAAHPQIVSNFPDLLENLDPAKPDTASVIEAFRAPQTAEARVALDGSGMSSMYARRHVKVQEVARKLVAQPGYADLLFLDDNGRIDYTTTKGADFGKSVTDDGLAGTALARLVERLKSADPGAVLYEDFAAYPVDGVPAAFIGRAMTKRANVAMGTAQAAERIGFIVMRVTPTLFDQTLSKRTGLGDTGQILAVGADGLLRSNPPLNPAVHAGAGLAGIGLAADRIKAGGPVDFAAENGAHMAAASAVTVLGAPWTVVAEQTQAEAIDAVQALSRTLILTGLFVLAGPPCSASCSPARSWRRSAPSPARSRPSPIARPSPTCRAASGGTRSVTSPGPWSRSATCRWRRPPSSSRPRRPRACARSRAGAPCSSSWPTASSTRSAASSRA
jgi:hypothetical protein